MVIKFQFIELNGRLMWCDFGANLVQHFMQRYSRYSRYRTKSHDKATISHDITRYSRYQTVLSKLQEIIILSSKLQLPFFGGCFLYHILYHRKLRKTDSRERLSSQNAIDGSICKEWSRPIYILDVLWYNYFADTQKKE